MSISDDLMWKYYELLTDLSETEISNLRSQCDDASLNPRNVKVELAKLIISDFHTADAADEAEADFNRRFVKKEVPDEIEERKVTGGVYKLVDLIAEAGLAASKGEARRLVEQGGVKVNGEKATAANADITIDQGGVLFQVGKRKFLKLLASD
jgi:tyrosyl-tRNA synthetase